MEILTDDRKEPGTMEQNTAPHASEDAVWASENRTRDDKGRPLVTLMTERAVTEETLLRLRALSDAIEALGQNPMARAMMPPGLFGG